MMKKIYLFLFILFALVVLSGCSIFVNKNNNNANLQNGNAINPELEKQYEKSVKSILQPAYLGQGISGIKQQILDLRAPAKYLDLHLNLVLIFDSIEEGQKQADQAKIEAGLDKLEQLKQQYPWLN